MTFPKLASRVSVSIVPLLLAIPLFAGNGCQGAEPQLPMDEVTGPANDSGVPGTTDPAADASTPVDGTDAGAPPADAGVPGGADAATPGGKDASAPSAPDASSPSKPDASAPATPDASTPGPSEPAFRFVAWGDTKSGLSALAALSKQVKTAAPVFTLYAGDLESSGFTSSGMEAFTRALNGSTSGSSSNGVADITFPIRGNHDAANTAGWQAYYDLKSRAASVGAKNFSELAADLSWSFDYANSHFVALDATGDVTKLTSAQLAWLDQDLAKAEARGVTHTFFMWHGPLWPVGGHCCSASNPAAIDVLNKHPSVAAGFFGHEHLHAWTHMNKARYPNLTHEFEQFHAGRAGAEVVSCQTGRADYCQDQQQGFLVIDVKGKSYTVSFHVQGSATPVKTMTFTKP